MIEGWCSRGNLWYYHTSKNTHTLLPFSHTYRDEQKEAQNVNIKANIQCLAKCYHVARWTETKNMVLKPAGDRMFRNKERKASLGTQFGETVSLMNTRFHPIRNITPRKEHVFSVQFCSQKRSPRTPQNMRSWSCSCTWHWCNQGWYVMSQKGHW